MLNLVVFFPHAGSWRDSGRSSTSGQEDHRDGQSCELVFFLTSSRYFHLWDLCGGLDLTLNPPPRPAAATSMFWIFSPNGPLQAERIMEALELYREETRKLEEHKYMCQSAEKEVETRLSLQRSVWKQQKDKKLQFLVFRFVWWVLFFVFFYFVFLQLPPPKPNPILVAFGNVSVSLEQTRHRLTDSHSGSECTKTKAISVESLSFNKALIEDMLNWDCSWTLFKSSHNFYWIVDCLLVSTKKLLNMKQMKQQNVVYWISISILWKSLFYSLGLFCCFQS